MDARERLDLLSQAAEIEGADSFVEPAGEPRRNLLRCVTHLQAPGGRQVAVLKILQSNACRNNCTYCAFRAGRDYRRVRLTPDELAASVDLMWRSGVIEGVFLSSGIGDTVKSMDDMLATSELLRHRYHFDGYLHLKLLPGVQAGQVEQAVALADRVSTNLEAPVRTRLATLAPEKRPEDLLGPLREASAVIRRLRAGEAVRRSAERGFSGLPSSAGGAPRPGSARLGMSTQFVVGPAGETDRELLETAGWLYRELDLTRAYYSAFRPVPDTPLEAYPPTDPRRQHRLYQADWLLRFYHFQVDELAFDPAGRLDASVDPKTVWARLHPERFPIEVNRAASEELLRVPGIGPATAHAIVRARRSGTVRSLGDLRRLGARAEQAAPYVLLNGQRAPVQLKLDLGED